MAELLNPNNKPIKEIKVMWAFFPKMGKTCCFAPKNNSSVIQTGTVVNIHHIDKSWVQFETQNTIYRLIGEIIK